MRIIDCEQGTEEWLKCRLGVPTSSNFKKILTPTGLESKQAEGYMNLLLAEIITGEVDGMEPNGWMQRGTETEPVARSWYEMAHNVDVKQVGFVMADGYGASPDGLVGDDGLVEIKVPAPQNQVANLLSGRMPSEYIPQIQGQMLVCEREWCDFLSYNPGMPPLLLRIERDEKYIAALSARLEWFTEQLELKRQRLIELGHLEETE